MLRRSFIAAVASLLGTLGLRREAPAEPFKLPDPDTKITIERVPWGKRYDKVHAVFSQVRHSGRQTCLYDDPAPHPDDPRLFAQDVEIVGEGWNGRTYDRAVVTVTYRRPMWELN